MTDHCFICYSPADALEFARRLADELEGGEDKFVDAWFDKRDIDPGRDWDDQIVEALKSCKCLLFVMTKDSTAQGSVCKSEWTWGLKYKKPVVPIRLQKEVDEPFGLGNRQWIDFTGEFEAGLAKLRMFLRGLDTPQGILNAMRDRLADAERDLRRAKGDDELRIKVEIEDLKSQIKRQEEIVKNPKAAEEQTQKNIETGLERERQPEKPLVVKTITRFINPPPGIAPYYFQDRVIETKQIVDFLKDDAQRLMTLVGRGGVGKTAMVCRLLKGLESGKLPDDLGEMKMDGIVYLSESGSHRTKFANIFADLSKLLPVDAAQKLDMLYKDPKIGTETKMRALLENFTDNHVVLLLDNFEPLIDEKLRIQDPELNEVLYEFLRGSHTSVNIIITTRVAPRELNLFEPGRQRVLTLDEGLESPYAENILREMDKDGKFGLKKASNEILGRARERTRGYPRALEALFAILASDRYTKLEELLAMPTPDNVVEAMVGEAFNRLDPTSQRVMQAVAIYNRPVAPTAIDYLLAAHLPGIDSALVLSRLVSMHFVRREAGKYYLHPVDREYALDKIPASAEELEAEWNQYHLLQQAANYFAQARKPRDEWKKLEDLNAQLAEFDLRYAAGDFYTATGVLDEIAHYLLLWGHYHSTIDLYLKVKDQVDDTAVKGYISAILGVAFYRTGQYHLGIKISELGVNYSQEKENDSIKSACLNNLGLCYEGIGQFNTAIDYYEKAINISKEINGEHGGAAELGNLANCYMAVGELDRAISLHKEALAIHQITGDKQGQGISLGNLAEELIDVGDYSESIQMARQYVTICQEINKPASYAYGRLALASLLLGNLEDAYKFTEYALEYDEPRYNHSMLLLQGIISLQQGNKGKSQTIFHATISQSDSILAQTPDFFDALDTKGLALCGLVIVEDKQHIATAKETFTAARKITSAVGIMKRVLRSFDELTKADTEGILSEVRLIIEGKE